MASDSDALRGLLARGDVIVQVALPSGACWASLCAVTRPRGRSAARAVVSAAGVRLEVPIDALLDARPVGR